MALSELLGRVSQRLPAFQQCTIDTSTLSTEDGKLKTDSNGVLDLSVLEPLRTANFGSKSAPFFLPPKLYVRPEMQTVFSSLVADYNAEEFKRVLLGSPGVGKSVLFFLSVLYRAAREADGGKRVYLRKTPAEPRTSAFVVEKGQTKDTVNILFSRAVDRRLSTLSQVFNMITEHESDNCFERHIDGPKHDDAKDVYSFDELCTSGRFLVLSQEAALGAITKIVLNGWTEEQIVNGLIALKQCQTDQEARAIYEYSGGRIRLAMSTRNKAQVWFTEVISSIDDAAVKLSLQSEGKAALKTSSDRLRTRFDSLPDGSVVPTTRKVVDSRMAFLMLKQDMTEDDVRNSYNLATALGLQSARGWFFEELLHRWFKSYVASPGSRLSDWMHPEGSVKQSVAHLNKHDLYWLPSVSNFANIDAAFVLNGVLYCLQYTVRTGNGFDFDTFWTDFAGQVLAKVNFTAIQVWFLTPDDVQFDLSPHTAKSILVSNTPGPTARSSTNNVTITTSFHMAKLQPGSAVGLNETGNKYMSNL